MHVSRARLVLLSAVVVGCQETPTRPGNSSPAAIRVDVLASDTDYPDAPFTISIDGGTVSTFHLPAATVVQQVPPGTHQVQFGSPDQGCIIVGGPERVVEVMPSDTVQLFLDVNCTARFGTVQLEVVTEGPDADSDGYVLAFDALGAVPVASNDFKVFSRVPAGPLTLSTLDGIASNCAARNATPDGSQPASGGRELTVLGAGRTTVTVRVDCHPVLRSRILFHTHEEGGLYTIHPDGHSLVELAPPGTYIGGEMALSPDGSRLAWVHGVGLNKRKGMTLMFLDGTLIAEPFEEPLEHPMWSHDGLLVLADNRADIVAVNPDGTGARVVRGGTHPDLLHLNGPLVFRFGGIQVAPTLTGTATTLTTLPGAAIPRWSPDGSRIVFLALADPNSRHQMFVMNAAGGDMQQMTYFAFGLGAPTWSPDGSRIAFGGDNNIWIAAPGSAGTLWRMDLPSLASLPMWSQVP